MRNLEPRIDPLFSKKKTTPKPEPTIAEAKAVVDDDEHPKCSYCGEPATYETDYDNTYFCDNEGCQAQFATENSRSIEQNDDDDEEKEDE